MKNDKDTLALSIKRAYFDDIVAGRQTREERDIFPDNEKKYIARYRDDKSGEYFESEQAHQMAIKKNPRKYDEFAIPEMIQYKRLKLITGAYNIKPRPYMIVEVEKVILGGYTEDNGDLKVVKDEKGYKFALLYVVYKLGKILEIHDSK